MNTIARVVLGSVLALGVGGVATANPKPPSQRIKMPDRAEVVCSFEGRGDELSHRIRLINKTDTPIPTKTYISYTTRSPRGTLLGMVRLGQPLAPKKPRVMTTADPAYVGSSCTVTEVQRPSR